MPDPTDNAGIGPGNEGGAPPQPGAAGTPAPVDEDKQYEEYIARQPLGAQERFRQVYGNHKKFKEIEPKYKDLEGRYAALERQHKEATGEEARKRLIAERDAEVVAQLKEMGLWEAYRAQQALLARNGGAAPAEPEPFDPKKVTEEAKNAAVAAARAELAQEREAASYNAQIDKAINASDYKDDPEFRLAVEEHIRTHAPQDRATTGQYRKMEEYVAAVATRFKAIEDRGLQRRAPRSVPRSSPVGRVEGPDVLKQNKARIDSLLDEHFGARG